MKNTNFKTKLIARALLLILLLASAVNFTACRNKGLEAGFKWKEHPDAVCEYFCAYKSDKRVFDINDVTLTFYYGGTQGVQCPVFKVYFENEDGDAYIVKEIRNHNPDDYKVDYEGYYRWTRVFNFSENITIPKELFVKQRGHIFFCLDITWSTNELINDNEWKNGNLIVIYYNVVGNTVELSEKEF